MLHLDSRGRWAHTRHGVEGTRYGTNAIANLGMHVTGTVAHLCPPLRCLPSSACKSSNTYLEDVSQTSRIVVLIVQGKDTNLQTSQRRPRGNKAVPVAQVCRGYVGETIITQPHGSVCSDVIRDGFICRKGSGNLRLAVHLPEGEDMNEWLAVHGTSDLRCVVCS